MRGHRLHSREIRGAGACLYRAISSLVGGGRGQESGPWGHRCSRTRHRYLAVDDHALASRARIGRDARRQPDAPTGWRTQVGDRDAQFHYLNEQVQQAQQRGEPAISVDTKKKELVGDFKNPGREWRPKGAPERVRVHDFIIPEKGKAIPYGVYDLTRDEGWVSVGIDHDTSSFAMNAIRSWWQKMGRPAYAEASHLLITADAGGSNGAKTRLWKWELQQFANRTGLSITVCHYPPGTSKWNKIEHRLFSYIAMNWRGKALTSLAAIVSLIGSTTTTTGLRVRSEIDKRSYPLGVSVSAGKMDQIRLQRHDVHGDWNYTIHPAKPRRN